MKVTIVMCLNLIWNEQYIRKMVSNPKQHVCRWKYTIFRRKTILVAGSNKDVMNCYQGFAEKDVSTQWIVMDRDKLLGAVT